MMTLALLLLALALGGACVVAWGCALRRNRPVRPLGGPLQARGGAAAPSAPSEAASGPLAGLSADDSYLRQEALAYIPHRWPGPVLPDAALSGLSRHEGADWTGWRPSYDGEDVDPGKPWRAGE